MIVLPAVAQCRWLAFTYVCQWIFDVMISYHSFLHKFSRWMAPESFYDGTWSVCSDAWMLGVLMWGLSRKLRSTEAKYLFRLTIIIISRNIQLL